MMKRYRSRRALIVLCVVTSLGVIFYISLHRSLPSEPDLDITRSVELAHTPRHIVPRGPSVVKELANVDDRAAIIAYIESKLEEALKLDKGTGCEIPDLDPFSKDVTRFDKKLPDINCVGRDWVKCYHSECRVVDSIRDTHTDIRCRYRDILYHNDREYTLGPASEVNGSRAYVLRASDHVKVMCTAKNAKSYSLAKWSGNTLGLRAVPAARAPPGRDDTLNVVIFGFDTTARNGFIRKMPNSWRALNQLGYTVMEGYNIVGDGTPAALFPILTGKTELELPDVRKSRRNNGSLDTFPFIFYKLKEDGYHTAYFEDMPHIGTFQYRFNGFLRQPADHYLRAFYLEEAKEHYSWKGRTHNKYCVGDTPQYRMMMNITQQFLELEGKRFVFTFIADITHDNFNMIGSADDDTVAFIRSLEKYAEDTLIIVMGDHGPRYASIRDTLQGKLEERLPLLAIKLPARLVRSRPHARRALEQNRRALTTPHDLHATILDALEWRRHWNPYRVQGADLPRGMTMLEPIPRNRSCSEAGIEPHWCACLAWQNVSSDDPMYRKTADALIKYINELVNEVGGLCAARTLTSTEWVLRQRANSRLLAFNKARDADGYVGHFAAETPVTTENYQVKIVVGPGRGVYEASMTYQAKLDHFIINTRDISRINAYSNEPDCISATHPHLNPFCYCV